MEGDIYKVCFKNKGGYSFLVIRLICFDFNFNFVGTVILILFINAITKERWETNVVRRHPSRMTPFCRCSCSTAVKTILILGNEVAPLRKVINSSDPVDMPRPYKFGDWDPAYGQTGLGIIYQPRHFYYEGGVRKGKPHGTGRIGWTN